MKKIAYILPGYCQSHANRRGYRMIADMFAAHGITPVQVEIEWKRNKPERFTDYTKQFLHVYKKPKGAKVYVLGFSYGATIAFLTAVKTRPDVLILCSLSPYFIEDFKNLEPAWLRWWQKNFTESDYSFAALAQKVRIETQLVAGSEEHRSVLIRARDARKKIASSRLTIARGAKHSISQKEYLAAVERVVVRIV